MGIKTLDQADRQLDVLFVSEAPPWPLDQGFCIRGYHMAQALQQLGVRVGVASHQPVSLDAPQPLQVLSVPWPHADAADQAQFMAGWAGPGAGLRRRLARHQGRQLSRFAGIVPLIARHRPSAVIGLGQHSPLMLRALTAEHQVKRIWYAADEPVRFHLTCLRSDGLLGLPRRLRLMALYAALERLFVRGLEGAVGVNPADTKLLRSISGARHTVTIRNGVDTDYFQPDTQAAHPKDLVFWGRMDFEPNIDATCWFVKKVFGVLKRLCPAARLQIVGKKPRRRVRDLRDHDGVEVLGAVPDIRPHARAAAITVLPMRCGGGIKNKLLEAAAMARPIVASPQALRGLAHLSTTPPWLVCRGAAQWIEAICRLWSDVDQQRRLGANARQWVLRHHSWQHAAGELMRWIEGLPRPQTDAIAARQAQRQPTEAEDGEGAAAVTAEARTPDTSEAA